MLTHACGKMPVATDSIAHNFVEQSCFDTANNNNSGDKKKNGKMLN